MKSIVAISAAIAVTIFPATAFATCPTITSGGTYYIYSFTTSCAYITGSYTNTTDSCGDTVHGLTGSPTTITYTYDIQPGDPIENSAGWEAEVYVQFSDPTSNANNSLTATVSVIHNRSTST